MPRHLHLDFESFSEIDLKDAGAYRYAFDPSTEILCAAMALDGSRPVVWSPDAPDIPEAYWDALEDPGTLIYAHNALFEMAMSQALLWRTWGITCPALSRFRCTMSFARRACLPGKLETLAEVLKLEHQKDKRGKALINRFCKLQTPKKPTKKNPNGVPAHRIYPKDDPQGFAELKAYCAQDVLAEMGAAKKLAYFDEPINNANYSLDAVINARGVPVNLSALRHAQTLIDEETEIVSAQFREIVGFNVTQGEKILAWLASNGVTLPDLQAATVEQFLSDYEDVEEWELPAPVLALRLRESISYAAIKKVRTMLLCAGPHDNRIRGMLNHHGAGTGRWTASLVQFQNMKRSTIKNWAGDNLSESAYAAICEGVSLEVLRLCFGPPLEVIASCIRHFVQDVV